LASKYGLCCLEKVSNALPQGGDNIIRLSKKSMNDVIWHNKMQSSDFGLLPTLK